MIETIRQLSAAVSAEVASRAGDGTLRPRPHPHLHTEFSQWEYTERGVRNRMWKNTFVLKDVWWDGPVESIVAALRDSIRTAAADLGSLHPDPRRVERAMEQLCAWLVLDAVEGKTAGADELARRADLLARSVRGEPVRAWVRADVLGVSVLVPPLEFDEHGVHVRLRAIQRADFETATFAEWSVDRKERLEANPSSVLELEYLASDGSGWQPPLERAIAVLKLFGVGGVAWSRVEAGTDSFLEIHNVFLFVDRGGGATRTYAIRNEDTYRLPHFFRTVGAALPEHFYWHSPEDPEDLHGAFFNYSGVVAKIGQVHDKIATVVRSLESLFLIRESKKVSALLRSRASTLLGACGYDGVEVRETLRVAYEVRSRFVHGDRPAAKTDADIRTHAGDIITLFERCLEYNRAALVAAVVSRLGKDEFICAIDSPAQLRRIGDAFRDAEGRGRSSRRKRRRTR
jgi:hypothetical protein